MTWDPGSVRLLCPVSPAAVGAWNPLKEATGKVPPL